MAGELVAFLGISILVIVTPGQDTALTIRNTLVGGRRNGAFTAIGVATGQAVWTIAASAGIAALLVASEPAFVALKLFGAAYLIYLGGQALRAALSGSRPTALRRGASAGLTTALSFRQGLISNLGNPKMALFFTSLLPQFGVRGDGAFLSLLVLGLLFCAMTLGWLTAYAFAVARAGDFLRRPAVRRVIDAVVGAVLVALGLRLAADRR